jgi:hypothetical protein
MHWAVIVSVSGVGRKRGAGAEAEARAHSTHVFAGSVLGYIVGYMAIIWAVCKYTAFISSS